MNNHRRSKRTALANLAVLAIFSLAMAGCGGGGGGGDGDGSSSALDSSSTPTPTETSAAAVIGTVPGTLIEAFCDNGAYYSVNSTNNNTAQHPFRLEIDAELGCRLVMTTNEGTPEEVVTPIGFLDADNIMHTRLQFTANSVIDLGYVPLPMGRIEAAKHDLNGDGILDSPFILDHYRSQGANNPLMQMDADHDGINDWRDDDHGGHMFQGGIVDPQDFDGDGIPNRYDENFHPAVNDTDGDGVPDNMDANPFNQRHNNGMLPGDHDGNGYHDNDHNHDGFDDNDTDRDGHPDMGRGGMALGGIDQGAILFGTYCVDCHAADGSTLGAGSPEAISAAVNSFTAMLEMASLLSEQDYQGLSDYINQGAHATGWRLEDNHGSFVEHNGIDICAACHGPELDGNNNIPSCTTCHGNEWEDVEP